MNKELFDKIFSDKLLVGSIGTASVILMVECLFPGPVPPVLFLIGVICWGLQKYGKKPETSKSNVTKPETPATSEQKSENEPLVSSEEKEDSKE